MKSDRGQRPGEIVGDVMTIHRRAGFRRMPGRLYARVISLRLFYLKPRVARGQQRSAEINAIDMPPICALRTIVSGSMWRG